MRLFLLLVIALGVQAADPPKQPIAFSHKQHAGELKLPCATCHVNPAPGEMMTFPVESKCMTCHQAIKTDSPEIQKLAKFAADKKRVPWTRVYQVPTFVFWSHKAHLDAGAKCSDCHGEVATLTLMSKEKETSMGACMECHRQKKVSNDCSFCHEKLN
ncbi:cytochrome c3 family protein [Bryobacter aggregatus]|uniref:cytochrome c3 family protein n=1 Tax=Bryobacter aggregatus TaxID=360054 RepID=UPI00068B379B|nr:cytochrome c3 family protein [Bryobacter aggregatus]